MRYGTFLSRRRSSVLTASNNSTVNSYLPAAQTQANDLVTHSATLADATANFANVMIYTADPKSSGAVTSCPAGKPAAHPRSFWWSVWRSRRRLFYCSWTSWPSFRWFAFSAKGSAARLSAKPRRSRDSEAVYSRYAGGSPAFAPDLARKLPRGILLNFQIKKSETVTQ